MGKRIIGRLDIKGNNKCLCSNTDPFEWYQKYTKLKEYLTRYIKPTDKLLDIGCGTSSKSNIIFRNARRNV